ncbi:hypothetical protein I551_5439 [Mycobacterium ulcerans str. Harvey]|uniref:Uncharacterized protein n=1 Tax=Mycobacterium ulcerans str. Harvey TaxID=1299332 RepID=A0ABN0QTT0_MYCUL|nr:hypothetical protein I551_5439 [Mycobacterium ulcerans str. Harvey]
MSWRRREGGVRPAADHDAVLAFAHRLDARARLGVERLPRHPAGNGHHDVDRQLTVRI